MKRSITCHCGNKVEYSFPDTYDVSREPGIVEDILENTFLTVTCESCGAELKPDFTMIFEQVKSPFGKICIHYLPELDRTRFLAGKIDTSCERIVIGYPELREKFLIFREGLDDRAVEILKFFLLEKADSSEDLTILLQEKGTETLGFYLFGLKAGEVGLSRIPLSLYERVISTYDERAQSEEVYRELSKAPYVSINKITLEDEA
jgi:predicted nucleic-acid-binding Zn-ribbon protein